MAKYFHISNDLRGCYMPDSVYVAQATTRKALKAALAYEAASLRDAGYLGLSKRAIASLAAATWREAQKPHPTVYDFVAPCSLQRGGAEYALAVSVATRRDYLDHCASEES